MSNEREAFESLWPAATCLGFNGTKYEPKYESHWMKNGAEQLNPIWTGFQAGAAYQREQVNSKCKCSMAIRMLGEGCRYCQPQNYIDHLSETIDELRTEANEQVKGLVEALELAANRLASLALCFPYVTEQRYAATEWEQEARQTVPPTAQHKEIDMSETIVERSFEYTDGKMYRTIKVTMPPCDTNDDSAWAERNELAERIRALLATPKPAQDDALVDQLGIALERVISTGLDQRTHHEFMSNKDHYLRLAFEAYRAAQEGK